MNLVILLLLIAALAFAILATLNGPARVHLIGSALACYFLSLIIPLLRTLFVVTAMVMLLGGCGTTATTWQRQLAPESLAHKTVVAVAEHAGGPVAGNLASAGLYAGGDVLQGYIDQKPPLDIIVQSPGVEGVGRILVDFLKDKGVVTQATVNAIHKAAAFAARLTYTADNK